MPGISAGRRQPRNCRDIARRFPEQLEPCFRHEVTTCGAMRFVSHSLSDRKWLRTNVQAQLLSGASEACGWAVGWSALLARILAELNDIAFGVLPVTHATTLKLPLPLRRIEFAAVHGCD